MKVAIYCRVSTEDQQEKRTIENQVDYAKKYCELNNFEIYKIYKDDGISGTVAFEERPAGGELLEDCERKNFKTILIYKLDRLGRSARITLNVIYALEKLDIQIKSMTEHFDNKDPSGHFTVTMLAGVADLERSTILERMWLGANRAAKEGKWLGGIVPYGYHVDENKFLQVSDIKLPNMDLIESDVIRLIFNLTVENHYSTIQIADYLNNLGVPTSYVKDGIKGKRKQNTANTWRPGNILRILHNTTYKGIHTYGKRSKKERELIERKVPAIVTEKTWDKAQEVIEENKLDCTRNRRHEYLLRGLIICGECGKRYVGTTNQQDRCYYKCNGKQNYRGNCKNKNLAGEKIETIIWEDIIKFVNNPGEVISKLKNNDTSVKKENKLKEISMLEKSLLYKEGEKQSILDLFRKNLINATDVEEQLLKIDKEYNSIADNIKTLKSDLIKFKDINYNDVTLILEELRKKIKNINFEDKQKIVRLLVNKIIVYPESVDITYFFDV